MISVWFRLSRTVGNIAPARPGRHDSLFAFHAANHWSWTNFLPYFLRNLRQKVSAASLQSSFNASNPGMVTKGAFACAIFGSLSSPVSPQPRKAHGYTR